MNRHLLVDSFPELNGKRWWSVAGTRTRNGRPVYMVNYLGVRLLIREHGTSELPEYWRPKGKKADRYFSLSYRFPGYSWRRVTHDWVHPVALARQAPVLFFHYFITHFRQHHLSSCTRSSLMPLPDAKAPLEINFGQLYAMLRLGGADDATATTMTKLFLTKPLNEEDALGQPTLDEDEDLTSKDFYLEFLKLAVLPSDLLDTIMEDLVDELDNHDMDDLRRCAIGDWRQSLQRRDLTRHQVAMDLSTVMGNTDKDLALLNEIIDDHVVDAGFRFKIDGQHVELVEFEPPKTAKSNAKVERTAGGHGTAGKDGATLNSPKKGKPAKDLTPLTERLAAATTPSDAEMEQPDEDVLYSVTNVLGKTGHADVIRWLAEGLVDVRRPVRLIRVESNPAWITRQKVGHAVSIADRKRSKHHFGAFVLRRDFCTHPDSDNDSKGIRLDPNAEWLVEQVNRDGQPMYTVIPAEDLDWFVQERSPKMREPFVPWPMVFERDGPNEVSLFDELRRWWSDYLLPFSHSQGGSKAIAVRVSNVDRMYQVATALQEVSLNDAATSIRQTGKPREERTTLVDMQEHLAHDWQSTSLLAAQESLKSLIDGIEVDDYPFYLILSSDLKWRRAKVDEFDREYFYDKD